MEVRPDFAARMGALAESLPREVLANLLTRLMPVEEVSTRAPSPRAPTGQSRDPFTRAQARRKRRPKTFNRPYKVLRGSAPGLHRRGTWTYIMVVAACAHETTLEAEAWLRREHPEYDYKVIDWQWLADVKNYITFNAGE
jgi:hypothetical protein